MSSKEKVFGFKDLLVWQKAIDYADVVIDTCEKLETERKHFRLMEQVESAAASISQNIAEGKGRNSKKEFIQYLYIARGSLNETVSLLNLFARRKWITSKQLDEIESLGIEIVSMLKGLINSISKSL